MQIHIHHYHHWLDQSQEKWLSNALTKLENKIMAALDDLTANVTADTSAVNSAITLLGNLKTQLDAAIAAGQNGDQSQLEALSQTLAANNAALAAAVTANTPAAPAATPTAPAAPGS